MGLFDRLLGTRPKAVKIAGQSKPAKPKQSEESFFLEPDAAVSLGDVNFMRRSNTIRRTFPGNADSPGGKELVMEVASMEARLETKTPGLAGENPDAEVEVNLTGGVPKPVKKTFAQQMSPAQLAQKLKGSAVAGVNEPGGGARRSQAAEGTREAGASGQAAKPGAIDPFKAMAKDLNG
jgi:hypothetical protein